MARTGDGEAPSRHQGGPGSSHQRPDRPDPTEGRGPEPGRKGGGQAARPPAATGLWAPRISLMTRTSVSTCAAKARGNRRRHPN